MKVPADQRVTNLSVEFTVDMSLQKHKQYFKDKNPVSVKRNPLPDLT